MFVGHYSASLAARAVDRRVPLWVYVAAGQWLDIFWSFLLIAGIEKVAGDPARTEGLDFISYPYSHSLLAALLWSSIALILAKLALRTSFGSAVLVALVVFSHWLLDLIVHHPDLPLWPGSRVRLGLSLWDLGSGEHLIEIILLAIAGAAWGIREKRWIAPSMFVATAAALMAAAGVAKPPGTSVDPLRIGLVGLVTYLAFVLLAFLIDLRSRPPKRWTARTRQDALRTQ